MIRDIQLVSTYNSLAHKTHQRNKTYQRHKTHQLIKLFSSHKLISSSNRSRYSDYHKPALPVALYTGVYIRVHLLQMHVCTSLTHARAHVHMHVLRANCFQDV